MDKTRDYYNNLNSIDNDGIHLISKPDESLARLAAIKGRPRPQNFIFHDQRGVIQDEWNIPILYHWGRHRFNKKIPTPLEMEKNQGNLKYSKVIPNRDINDNIRLTKKYWWLDKNLEKYYIKFSRRNIKKYGNGSNYSDVFWKKVEYCGAPHNLVLDHLFKQNNNDEAVWETPKNVSKISQNVAETVSTKIDNRFDTLSDNDKEIDINSVTATQPKKISLPIYALAESCTIKNLAKILRNNPELCGKFRLCHPTGSRFITITTNDVSTFNLTKSTLDLNKIYYYSYTPKHLRPKSLVLKGIRGDYTIEEIQEELNSKKPESITITKVMLAKFSTTKLQKELGLKNTQASKIRPNLNTTRNVDRPLKKNIRDFTTTIADKGEKNKPGNLSTTTANGEKNNSKNDEEWETPKLTTKLSQLNNDPVSTITSNEFDNLSNNGEEINLESTTQTKKTVLPIYALAESCTIRNLATILRNKVEICGKFRLNHPTSGSKYITITTNDVSTFTLSKETLDLNKIPYFSYKLEMKF
ncbi:hypothetical protein PV328_007247 [Microctonus aethiopoides]|uniref:Uncharacterized protein n=1 Tax=Microctonus aethiopoides TaxID=144406 RepID=A0AA39FR32_9HYME|nr:hypothetical protein PV328_007247 [Microctonus aethiopoides]